MDTYVCLTVLAIAAAFQGKNVNKSYLLQLSLFFSLCFIFILVMRAKPCTIKELRKFFVVYTNAC